MREELVEIKLGKFLGNTGIEKFTLLLATTKGFPQKAQIKSRFPQMLYTRLTLLPGSQATNPFS